MLSPSPSPAPAPAPSPPRINHPATSPNPDCLTYRDHISPILINQVRVRSTESGWSNLRCDPPTQGSVSTYLGHRSGVALERRGYAQYGYSVYPRSTPYLLCATTYECQLCTIEIQTAIVARKSQGRDLPQQEKSYYPCNLPLSRLCCYNTCE